VVDVEPEVVVVDPDVVVVDPDVVVVVPVVVVEPEVVDVDPEVVDVTATVQETLAAGPVRPLFVASTANVCVPFARFEYVAGEVHDTYAPPSSEQLNVAPV
jgi:hypothetical protein